ncbi:DUF2946 family protein [Immundisolibacter sp.]|uniref:DUF2946 family protein n=1 Tax=Immundisolibacter sp. TaxID=1934948 RepID=UPI00262C7CFB|nr:DUF2946 family protein [Immundisolibacter sp.]MDD3650587.1 DUF2946 family protein [Immundisolibacter sp.]
MTDAPAVWSAGQPLAGWLRLSARGVWLIRDAAVEHPALRAHLNRHYFRDAAGCYCVQNGAQVVYVRLDYAPYALHVTADGALIAHTDQPAGAARAAYLDEAGALTLLTALGAGRVDEASLAYFADRVCDAAGRPADAAALAELMAGGAAPALFLDLPTGCVPIERCLAARLPALCGFVRDPGRAYANA